MRIASIECYKVSIPWEAPILTAYGSLKTASRSLVKMTAENGLEGWGEASAWVTPLDIAKAAPLIVGRSAWDFRAVRERLENVNYYKKTPLMNAAVEMAMLDLAARSVDLPVWAILGGKLRDEVPTTAYMFYQHDPATTSMREESDAIEDIVARASRDVERYGFKAVKVKGATYHPAVDLEVMTRLRSTFPDHLLRIDPQGAWTLSASLRWAAEIDRLGLNLEYLEDPCDGLAAMAEVKRRTQTPLSTNMCVTQWEHLQAAARERPVDVILSDLWYWGGIEHTLALDKAARALGFGVGVHSGVEFGIALAAMVHSTAVMPNALSPIDQMHTLAVDDILVDRLLPVDGAIRVPDGPGWGVDVDPVKLEKYRAYAESPESLDRYLDPSQPDDRRPGWTPRLPAW